MAEINSTDICAHTVESNSLGCTNFSMENTKSESPEKESAKANALAGKIPTDKEAFANELKLISRTPAPADDATEFIKVPDTSEIKDSSNEQCTPNVESHKEEKREEEDKKEIETTIAQDEIKDSVGSSDDVILESNVVENVDVSKTDVDLPKEEKAENESKNLAEISSNDDEKCLKQESNKDVKTFDKVHEINDKMLTEVDENVSLLKVTREDTPTENKEEPELGIVGPPTAVRDLVDEEELMAEPALPIDSALQENVTQWVQNSVKVDEKIEPSLKIDGHADAKEEEESKKCNDVPVKGRRGRRKKTEKDNRPSSPPVATRKSQRVISNIIKRSIKWSKMPQCAVATCRNSHRRTRGRRIRYHRFPRIPEVRSRWVRACGRVPLSNGEIPFNIKTARICSLHFTIDSYEKDMEHLVLGLPMRSRLRRGAVPTIDVPVNVQPVTKMLVEDAKRSLLKVAHSKIISQKALPGDTDAKDKHDKTYKQHRINNIQPNAQQQQQRAKFNAIEKKIDFALALGLEPCLNKMHAMDNGNGSEKKADANLKQEEDPRQSPKVPHNRQNGAALPEETATTAATENSRSTSIKKEPNFDAGSENAKNATQTDLTNTKSGVTRHLKHDDREQSRKRSIADDALSTNGNPVANKKICLEQREQFISSLVNCEQVSAEELSAKAEQLRAEVQALDELARAKEMEWNEILSMRKLKEEAYLRIERRRQVVSFMESNGSQSTDGLPPATMSLPPEWDSGSVVMKEKRELTSKIDNRERGLRDTSPTMKKDRASKFDSQKQSIQHTAESKKQLELQNIDNRQIGEGRQGPIVDVRSIIADYRLRHPETVPRRGRRLRNSVNIGLGAGGAMVENVQNVDSRPSSTDSCKSNPNTNDPNNSMSFKDVLVQFAKLSQQQGEPVKTPQNYPDVTLHPVAPSPTPQNASVPSQQTGSLLHGILTKSQSPRPTTFSPTLARLLTAPERERNATTVTPAAQQSSATQHLLQTYQSSNPVSISDLLSSSKARTEITITPVVNPPVQSHSNNLIQVEDVEEESPIMEERDSRISGSRDNRDDRDSPPRCQGCLERAAQFVCAGCGNQWYCSRECQVSAWDEHSEVCSG